MEATIRKMEYNMTVFGSGIILLSIWSLVKSVLTTLFSKDFRETLPEHYETLTIIVIWVIAVLDMLIRLYVGLSSMKESRGKKKHRFYLIVVGALCVLGTITIVLDVLSFFVTKSGYAVKAITIVIDLTATVLWVELFVSAIRLRKLRKQLTKGDRT